MLGYIVDTSRFAVIALVRHAFLNGTCALKTNNKKTFNCNIILINSYNKKNSINQKQLVGSPNISEEIYFKLHCVSNFYFTFLPGCLVSLSNTLNTCLPIAFTARQ